MGIVGLLEKLLSWYSLLPFYHHWLGIVSSILHINFCTKRLMFLWLTLFLGIWLSSHMGVHHHHHHYCFLFIWLTVEDKQRHTISHILNCFQRDHTRSMQHLSNGLDSIYHSDHPALEFGRKIFPTQITWSASDWHLVKQSYFCWFISDLLFICASEIVYISDLI